MSLTLILIITVVVLFMILFACANAGIKLRKRIDELEEDLIKKEESISYLYRHSEEITKIHNEKSEAEKEVENAKTDEEINAIVSSIVNANNSKLQNN
jgi:predicted Holliday junction resolvase-like endonuclease